ncbi:Lipoxygenase [Heracleum sosnowskyi]|uniref:Lipoxygenase n=1 Tax=Heracleum sosnowskyi TaxID=360622 RepID=A0AAD8HRK3_9APIA|nr:Lipoxygenase [Heracleum sosnowskyi]
MLKPQLALNQQSSSSFSGKDLSIWHIMPFASSPLTPLSDQINRKICYSSNKSHTGVLEYFVRATVVNPATTNSVTPDDVDPVWNNIKVTATIIVQAHGTGVLNYLSKLSPVKSGIISVELVAAKNYPDGKRKSTIQQNAEEGEAGYTCTFNVGNEFGEIGGVILRNRNREEIYVKDIYLDAVPGSRIAFNCESWLQPDTERIFFTNKSYIPSQTPSGLIDYRKSELSALRGNHDIGEPKCGDRIYDYDVYNDLGDPDKSEDLKRKVLGGNPTYPYPRRCRTGRPRSKKDNLSESRRKRKLYVPRDEYFSEVRLSSFNSAKQNAFVPAMENILIKEDGRGFSSFREIDLLFDEKDDLSTEFNKTPSKFLPNLGSFLNFRTPELLERDKFAWMKDEEFGRQTLAGVNPCTIQLIKEWPLKSNLAHEYYGQPESAITKDLVESMMAEHMTVEKAIEEKRLFVIDYHDLMLPFVDKVRNIEGTNLYGSRALFFRTTSDTLKPMAIELVRPPCKGKPQWKEAYTPSSHGTSGWLWMLAKAQFLALDSGYHQLISHWLRTHCVVEPYVIATNRQLSAMHPIYRLLKPHFRDTMEINAVARDVLVNSGGIIEKTFSPGKYSMEMSSVAYRELWRFDQEGLPADLIRRGMAEEDRTSDTGVKLTIEDYPYASDGILLWTIIKKWVNAYVSHYYPDESYIEFDYEIKNWWTEIRTIGHGDKKDETWWPKLQTPEDLTGILTTMIWISSGHHAAVNFGQYDYAAYFPNRPTISRTKMPTEDPTDKSWDDFLSRPEDTILSCFPTCNQACMVVATLDVLSQQSEDEQYIGQKPEPSWAENAVIKAEFELFRERLKEVNKIIDERNRTLKNRSGAGVIPYTLLKTTTKDKITGKGVPNSITI